MIQSPLNYTGGKFKLLPQILPLLPKNVDRFFDFFCGGCNVGINVRLIDTLSLFFLHHKFLAEESSLLTVANHFLYYKSVIS